jgi:translocator protein
MSELASRGQLRMSFVRWALVTVPAVILLGFLSANVGGSGATGSWYVALEKPALQPPGIAFPIAWTILYALMGLALAMIIVARGAKGRTLAFMLFAAQLAVNLTWSPVFFGMHRIALALGILVAMFVLTLGTIAAFQRVRPRAALLMLPYLAWIMFAGYLNWEILRLNPNAETLAPGRPGTQFDLD